MHGALSAALAAVLLVVPGDASGDLYKRAKAALDKREWQATCDLVADALARGAVDGALEELYATALERLNRNDEAAHAYDSAARKLAAAGVADRSKLAVGAARRLDPIAARRDQFFAKAVDVLADCAEDLSKNGHGERALALLERLPGAAAGKDAARVAALLTKVRAAFEKVDLNAAASDETSAKGEKATAGPREVFEYESEHYEFRCALEPSVVKRLGEVMDDIHAYYVQIYFDGDAKKARTKATIVVHPDRETMLKHWQGASAPEGWWSPGTGEVHTYDTRTGGGSALGSGSSARSLDAMLETLFHEASHQFMTLLSQGGFVPAWLNEGTASFFEGAVAMADGQVLWPRAALARLGTLSYQLEEKTPKITVADVIGFAEGGSYPPEYYSYGWGLAYFLQQYEDKTTLEHVYRPLYAEYRAAVIRRGGEPRAVFDEVFLGKRSPLGHATFDDFAKTWKRWILDEVRPLHQRTSEARVLRLKRAERYLAAADLAKGDKKAAVDEAELLARALSEIEYVRSQIDRPDAQDGDLLVMQADLLQRLKRPAAAAPLLEQVLDLADAKEYELDAKRYEELSKRLAKIDGGNAAQRKAKSSVVELGRIARALLADYERADPPLVLRGYTFASLASGLLPDDAELAASVDRLRTAARDAKLLRGSIRALDGGIDRWETIFSSPAESFTVEGPRIELEAVRNVGFVDARFDVSGEYEVRATVAHGAEVTPGAALGFVIAGGGERDWWIAGFDERGQAGVWSVKRSANGGVQTRRVQSFFPKPPLEKDEKPLLAVRVLVDGTVKITIGAREPLSGKIDLAGGVPRNVGIYAKNTTAVFEDLVVEIVP